MPEDVPRHAAENLLSQTRVGICAHGQQVAVELFGRRQQTSAHYVVDWFEHPQISVHRGTVGASPAAVAIVGK